MIQLLSHIKTYALLRAEYYKLKAVEKLSDVFSTFFSFLILVLLAMFTILFIGLALGFYLNYCFNSVYMGFVITAGFYVLFFILLSSFTNQLVKKPIMNMIIKAIFKNEEQQ